MRRLLALIALAACDGTEPLGEARTFRDDFEPPDAGWRFNGEGARDEDGFILVSTVGRLPSAEYTLPSPFGPGWDFEVNAGSQAGEPCLDVEMSTGDSRRHGWFLQLDPARDYWALQVGDGEGWERLASSIGQDAVENPTTARLMVKGDTVGLWLGNSQVLETTIEDGAPNVVDINLGVSRCNLVAGVAMYDWVQIKELPR
ncbi:MAG: hypothetical protein OXQ94_03515 [Gemmatimonadota bacterium]|nr:hypothetical protein [Gemmatimonadota bacterium]MDE2870748.1 hypothetical protein [Gemmatimonadota bacterium]